jgi:hypothetical protein
LWFFPHIISSTYTGIPWFTSEGSMYILRSSYIYIYRITSNLRSTFFTFFPVEKMGCILNSRNTFGVSHQATSWDWCLCFRVFQRHRKTDLVMIIPSGMTRDNSEQSGEGASSSENESATERSLDELSA